MALHGQRQIRRPHADAVVLHQDAGDPAAVQRHADVPGAGIQGVLHQLLHRRRRAFHHLAGGDAVGGLRRQQADGAGARRAVHSAGHSARRAAMEAAVAASGAGAAADRAGRISFASRLPSSTPH